MSLLLKLENAALLIVALLIVALLAYYLSDGSWWLFGVMILVPDLSMIGYVAGPRIGAWCYNIVHTWLAPTTIGLMGWAAGSILLMQIALILSAHIAADRMLGYGLKHESGFKDTHLRRIG